MLDQCSFLDDPLRHPSELVATIESERHLHVHIPIFPMDRKLITTVYILSLLSKFGEFGQQC